MTEFAKLVEEALSDLRAKEPNWKSWHEINCRLADTQDAFWQEACTDQSSRNRPYALTTLVKLAAIAQKAAEDLALVDDHVKNIDTTARRKLVNSLLDIRE